MNLQRIQEKQREGYKKNQESIVSHKSKDKNISKGEGTELKNVQRTRHIDNLVVALEWGEGCGS